MAWRIGVDIGGTFTDVALVDDASGRIGVAKVPTTPADLAASASRQGSSHRRPFQLGMTTETAVTAAPPRRSGCRMIR